MPLNYGAPTQIVPGLDIGGIGSSLDWLRPHLGMGLSQSDREAILAEEEKKKKLEAAKQMIERLSGPRPEWMDPAAVDYPGFGSDPREALLRNGGSNAPGISMPLSRSAVQASVPEPPAPGIPGDPPRPYTVDDAIAELAGVQMEQRKRMEIQKQMEESAYASREMAAREAGLKRFVGHYNESNAGMDTPYGPNARGSYTSGNLDGSMPTVNRGLYEEDLRRQKFSDDVLLGRVNPGRLSRMEALNATDDIAKLERDAAQKEAWDRTMAENNGGKLYGPRSEDERIDRLKKQGGIPYHRAVVDYLKAAGATDESLAKEGNESFLRVGRADKLKDSVAAMKTRMAERAKRIRDENERKSSESRQRNREAWLATVPRNSALGGQVEGDARVQQAGITSATSIETVRMMMQASQDNLERIAEKHGTTSEAIIADPASPLYRLWKETSQMGGMQR